MGQPKTCNKTRRGAAKNIRQWNTTRRNKQRKIARQIAECEAAKEPPRDHIKALRSRSKHWDENTRIGGGSDPVRILKKPKKGEE